jgi:hypothetical protein
MKSMFNVFRSLRTRVLVGTAILGVGAFALVANVDARSGPVRAKEWASLHHASLPQTLEEFAAYPADYQQAIRTEWAPEDQSRLWRTQLRFVLATERDLTAAQRAFIQHTIDQATPESFEPGADHPEICADIAALFPDKRQRKLIVTLGSDVAPVATWRPFLVSLTERVRTTLVAHADIIYCNCRGLGLCECGLFEGCLDMPNCVPLSMCGCIWQGPCDPRTCQSGLALTTATKK